eukprot:8373071-Pyramimonas_sp.AAC.2
MTRVASLITGDRALHPSGTLNRSQCPCFNDLIHTSPDGLSGIGRSIWMAYPSETTTTTEAFRVERSSPTPLKKAGWGLRALRGGVRPP